MIYSPFPRTLVIIFLTFFYGTVSFGQKPVRNYETQWKRVEEFTKKGLPKSALEEVRKIYALAKKENQDAQLIKSLVYITGLQQENRDDNEVLSISEIEREIATGPEPARSILQSLLADIYWNYYQQNRWKLYDRTKTENFNKPDIKTWGIEDFHREVSSLYLQSIKDVKLLQRTGLPAFAAILQPGNMRHLRPTLFDLLAHRAISYFANNERDITKPAYAFEISQAGAFDPAADFIRLKFPTDDTASLQQKALLVYQQLIAFHLGDKKPDALIDADLMRLAFVKENSTHPEKDRLYLNSILRLTRQYGILPAASQAWYLLASYYNEQANAYKPHGDTTGRFARLQAKAICEQVLMQKDSSEGKVNCRNLLNEIQRPSFRFTLEKVNLPGKPFRTLVNYRNINKLYLRVIRPGEELKKLLEKQYDPGYWSALAAAPSLSGWEQKLPDTRDFQEHSVELKVEGLPVGEYILLASDSPSFNDPGARLGARFFYVSGISYVNNDDDYFVLDRDHGGPLDGARVDVWIQRYDYSLSKYVREKEKEHRTDKHGFFRMTRKPRDENQYGSFAYQLEITHGQDHLFINENLYDYYYSNTGDSESKPVQSIHLFTDRSLYRPGQTVYFKGIALTRNSREKTGSVLAGFATTVYLRNASFKDIDSILVKTSEYGSFSGRFQLPETGLNGQFTLHTMDIQASAIIRMEEYKRPKFYVDFEPLKGTYKVNDQIRVTGLARAYAGNNVDGATVSYRVVREPRFIYPWMFWRWWQPPAESMEIKHGIARTDKEGKFIVEFTALPDGKIDKKFEPVFDYTIYADVTDINGETRSSSKSVSVSYKALALLVNIPSTLPADSLDKLNLRTQNMNGEFEPSMVNVTLTKIKQEDRLIRERFWQRPDQFVMSKDDYIRLFPNDEYDNETDLVSWAKESQVFNRSDSTRDNLPWALGRKSWTPGFYMIEITTKDRHGEEVRDIKYIELYNEKNESLNRPVYLWKGVQKTGVEPGETALVEFGTAADNLHVIQTIDKDVLQDRARTPEYTFLTMNRNKSTFSFKVSESDRGGFGTGWMFVKHNRVYQHNQVIRVPWTNKDLSVEYMTFREKTLPGSDEKWKIRITGFKKEQVAAEMLASMYDASLDQFYPHNWDEPGIWPSYYSKTAWNSTRNFDFVQSYQKYVSDKISNQLDKRYEQLISISLFGVSYQFRNMVAEEAPPAPLPDQDADGVADTSVNEVVVAATKDTRKQTGKKEGGANEEPGNGKQETQIRRNFNETAFFLPDLRTDSTGAIEFSFTMPEALTRWKFMALAHTRDAAFGNSTKEIVTQKDLMVQPNPPRFMREGDKMEFSSKIVNLTNKEITGTAEFRLFDAFTNEPVDGRFRSMVPNQYFTVGAGQSEVLKFPIEIPYQFNTALVWRIVARAGGYSDGEENTLPVLSNRMLVTETMPLPFRGTGSRNFTFTGLLNSVNSESLQHRSLTVEYTSNPAWYAVQALPYLMDYPYECAEQTWNRYYANSLATFIANSSPRIKQVFEKWKIADTTALLSNLQKNQELKSVLLEETPWMLQARSETEQKRNIALLFDMVRMSRQLDNSYEKLRQMQSSNGGFVWFSGGPDDRYITQYIVTGIGHLKKINAAGAGQTEQLDAILRTALPYLDRKLKEDYDDLTKHKSNMSLQHIGSVQVQYLYMRSFFPGLPVDPAYRTAYDFYYKQARQFWGKMSKYMQGMIALAMYRGNDRVTSQDILRSLKETAVTSEETGMYWKDLSAGWFWYEAPIERQSLLIEAFQEAGSDLKTVDELRTWLLKNKQTTNWKTTKATAEACYALLLRGTDWLSSEPDVEIQVGNTVIRSRDEISEAGTGYFQKTIAGDKVNPQMGNITVRVENTKAPNTSSVSWGGVYWQYFEDLDKIKTSVTPLSLSKKLFVEKNTDRGPVISPVENGGTIRVGDKIRVRIELRIDRDMEYVHMKDMRASALEPVNVLSSYKWQGGLGYYESTRDASTNFFFPYLRKGTYVFEYSLFATHNGNFSNGVTTIQCMYAPEFSSHSEGIRIDVEQ